jgi:hypothetical protein
MSTLDYGQCERRTPHAARLTNRLTEDEIITDRFLKRQRLLIQPVQNVQTEQLVREVDAERFEGLDFQQHAQQEDIRTEHERRVVNDLGNSEPVASRSVSG